MDALDEQQILARAQEEVASHRLKAAEQPRNSFWGWLGLTAAVAVLVAFFAAPGPLPQKLLLAMGGVCALRPDHSYFAGELQLPLESRMMGIYGGFLLTLIVLLVFRRPGARRLGHRLVIAILALMFTSMVFDGINSTLAEVGLPHLYPPSNLLRLVTGLLSGIATAPALIWLLGVVAMPDVGSTEHAVVPSWRELVAPLVLGAVFAGIVINGHAALYYPLALIGITGVVTALTGAALLATLTISGLDGSVRQLRQMLTPGAFALLLTFAMLATMATLRWIITPAL